MAIAKSAKDIFQHRGTQIEEDKSRMMRKLAKLSCFYPAFICVPL
jgi:hypothetical protein